MATRSTGTCSKKIDILISTSARCKQIYKLTLQVQAVEEGGVRTDGDGNEEAEPELGISRAGASC